MNITVEELENKVEETISETTLQRTIKFWLTRLRRAYSQQEEAFTSEQIHVLDKLEHISEQLDLFIELQKDAVSVYGKDDFDDLMEQFEAVREELEGLAVQKRVDKEIRELQCRFPRIYQSEGARRQSERLRAIARLQDKAPRCDDGHLMVVRKGKRGYFWGCSSYPRCNAIKDLTCKEKAVLHE